MRALAEQYGIIRSSRLSTIGALIILSRWSWQCWRRG